MNKIRPFNEEDIPQVAELYRRVFFHVGDPVESSHSEAPPTPEVIESFTEIFFRNPWFDEGLTSIVCEDRDGKVIGFLGVTPRRMLLRGRQILAAVSVHFMLDPERQAGLAGVQILKSFFAGPQDLSIADFANNVGRKVWEGIGGMTAHLHSLNWVKLLRPGTHVLSLASRRLRVLPLFLAHSIGHFSDAVLARVMPHHFRFSRNDLTGIEPDDETLLACISQNSAAYSLRPQYDYSSLAWLLRRAETFKVDGNLQKVALRSETGDIVGWYLYYLVPGGTSTVLQLGARKNEIGRALDHLFHHAWSNGSFVITGRLEPQLMQGISDKECYFKCGPPWVLIHTRDSEILQAIDRGDAFMTTLDGEWCTSYRR